MASGNENDVVAILNTARRLINDGNPAMALQAVVTALKMAGGEAEVAPALKRAHEQYQSQARASAAAEELSALLAECAIAEVSRKLQNAHNHTTNMLASTSEPNDMDYMMEATVEPVPILAESGRMQVVRDASVDGSSFICPKCAGVVSNARRDEHMYLWCSQAPNNNN